MKKTILRQCPLLLVQVSYIYIRIKAIQSLLFQGLVKQGDQLDYDICNNGDLIMTDPYTTNQ